MRASSKQMTGREVIAGVGAFVLTLLTWAVALFAPLHEDGPSCPGGKCRVGWFSALYFRGGLNQFVAYYPSSVLFILAFLLLAALVALGAYLHGTRHIDAARWLILGAAPLLALLLPVASGTMAALGTPLPAIPYPIGEVGNPLVLGLAVCVGLAMLASMQARGQRAEGGGELAAQKDGASREGGPPGTTTSQSASPARAKSSVWCGKVAAVAGMTAFALALLTWAVALFAPLYKWQECHLCLPAGHGQVSLVGAAGGFAPFVQANLFLCLFILALLFFSGLVALGVSLYGRRGTTIIGHRLVWGGSIALLLVVAAMTTLPFADVPDLVQMGVTPLRIPLLPDPSWEGVANVYFDPAVLTLIVGPSVCAALAVIATIATGPADAAAVGSTMARSGGRLKRRRVELATTG